MCALHGKQQRAVRRTPVAGVMSAPRQGTTEGVGMDRPRFTRAELAFIIGVPAAWAILLLFHPIGGEQETFYPTIDGNVVAWQAVHVGMGVFVALFAIAIFVLLRGVEGVAATISRVGLVVFAIFYAAFEITLGVGTGILTDNLNSLPEAEQAPAVEQLEAYADSGLITAFTFIGSIGLAMALVGAAVALRNAYELGLASIALIVLSVPLIAIHEPPFGPVGLAMFIIAVVLFVRQGTPEPSQSPAVDQSASAQPA